MIVRKEGSKEMKEFVMDSFNRDDAGDAFRLLSYRLSEGNKKKNEISFLNYEKEIRDYELL